jgi:hypothetical protein
VTSEIRIYIEGSGRQKAGTIGLRKAFGSFLSEPRRQAQKKGIRLRPILCGSRSNTFDDFRRALHSCSDAVVMLLVDAEAPVRSPDPWHHLRHDSGDGWEDPGAPPNRCHLMVQTMEAWLIADPERLDDFYGKGFQASALPRTANLEDVPKKDLIEALERAARGTAKRTYHKTQHGPAILTRVRPDRAARRALHCKRLFDALYEVIESL